MNDTEKIQAIKVAAASKFGREAKIFNAERRKVDTKGDHCWQLRMIDLTGAIINGGDAPCCRLDIMRGDVNHHTIFYLKDDLSEKDLEKQFTAMIVDCEEYMEEHAGAA